MKLTAVIDRFESNKAVFLVGDGEKQVVWPRELLPAGAAEGDIISIIIDIDNEETSKQKQEAEDLLKDLVKKK